MAAAVLDIVLAADHKKISTEHLCHIAAALDITPSGSRNLRFKLRAAMRNHVQSLQYTSVESRSLASVGDFFNSFEAHLKPVLLSIAALHRVQLPAKPSTETIRKEITKHILHGQCTQFSYSHPPSTLPLDVSIPDCVDVCNEWEANNIDPDLQVHILTAIYGSKTSPNAMRRILDILNIQHDPSGPVKTYHKQLRAYILTLRKGKRVEREQQAKTDAIIRLNEQLQKIRESWPQLVPQSLKDKIITEFCEMTSSEALTTFTCASCAEAIPLCSHFSLSITEFDCQILK
ncbi:hypothetical protein FB451DRAFT_1172772 [Mycena latifolia]|nr:hypothetical protein FB451DRAFT_1172772 [Mycena latifolia]